MGSENRAGEAPGRGDVLGAIEQLGRELDGYEVTATGEHDPPTAEEIARHRRTYEEALS